MTLKIELTCKYSEIRPLIYDKAVRKLAVIKKYKKQIILTRSTEGMCLTVYNNLHPSFSVNCVKRYERTRAIFYLSNITRMKERRWFWQMCKESGTHTLSWFVWGQLYLRYMSYSAILRSVES